MIRFGIEHEFFIFRLDGCVPRVADILQLYKTLEADGYETDTRHAVTGQPLSVSKVALTEKRRVGCDYCSNTLELTLPPHDCEDAFRAEFSAMEAEVLRALESVGLERKLGATLDAVPENVVLWPSHTDPTGERLQSVADRRPTDSPLFCREIFAIVASTQVHLELPREEGFRLLPHLYSLEWLVPLYFSHSSQYLGRRMHSARALAIWENFDASERMLGIPDKIATSEGEYMQLNAGKQRDYSFIAPREQTFEFRSADSQPDADAIWRLIEFRQWQVEVARSREGEALSSSAAADAFRSTSEAKPSNVDLARLLRRLKVECGEAHWMIAGKSQRAT